MILQFVEKKYWASLSLSNCYGHDHMKSNMTVSGDKLGGSVQNINYIVIVTMIMMNITTTLDLWFVGS